MNTLLLIYNTPVFGASEISFIIKNYFLVQPKFIQTILESINSVSRYDMIRQTVPNGYYPVSKVEFSHVIVTVMLNQIIFITSSSTHREYREFMFYCILAYSKCMHCYVS